MNETTLYLAWVSYWEGTDSVLLSVHRTPEGAQAALDSTNINPAIMSRWVETETLRD